MPPVAWCPCYHAAYWGFQVAHLILILHSCCLAPGHPACHLLIKPPIYRLFTWVRSLLLRPRKYGPRYTFSELYD